MANKFFGAISHIGGTDGDLDAITKDIISDGDGAYVLDAVNNTIDVYTLIDSDATAEDGVDFTTIVPDDEAAPPTPGKRWRKVAIGSYDGTTNIVHADIVTLTGTQTLTNKTLTSPVFNTGVSGTAVDTDNTLAANSDTLLASQKAIKSYVDSQVTAQDLDFIGDAGGAQTIDLDSQTLSILGGTGLASTGSAQTMTLNIDSTVATLTGSQTLTNKTLTLPQINDTSSNHQYIFAVNELIADRTVTLPLLTGADEFVFKDHAVTMTNKTLTSPAVTNLTGSLNGATGSLTAPAVTNLTGSLNGATGSLVAPAITGAATIATGATITTPIITTGLLAKAGETAIAIAPDGAVDLYYNNLKVLTTNAGGIGVYDTSGDDPAIFFYSDGAVEQGYIRYLNGNFVINDSINAEKTFEIIANGATSLYHNAVTRLETSSTGVTISGAVSATTMNTTAGNEWTAQQGFNESALTSAASTAWNCDTKQCALLTLGHNATIAAPTNQQAGTTYQLRVVQAAGLYTLAWNAVFKWGAAATPVAPAASGDVVIFSFYSDGTNMYGTETNRTEA